MGAAVALTISLKDAHSYLCQANGNVEWGELYMTTG